MGFTIHILKYLTLFNFFYLLNSQTECDKLSEKSSESPSESTSFVEIDLSSENPLIASPVRRSSNGYLEIAKALMGNKRDTLLKIVETDDDES